MFTNRQFVKRWTRIYFRKCITILFVFCFVLFLFCCKNSQYSMNSYILKFLKQELIISNRKRKFEKLSSINQTNNGLLPLITEHTNNHYTDGKSDSDRGNVAGLKRFMESQPSISCYLYLQRQNRYKVAI